MTHLELQLEESRKKINLVLFKYQRSHCFLFMLPLVPLLNPSDTTPGYDMPTGCQAQCVGSLRENVLTPA